MEAHCPQGLNYGRIKEKITDDGFIVPVRRRNCWYFTSIVARRIFWKLSFNYCVPEINIGSMKKVSATETSVGMNTNRLLQLLVDGNQFHWKVKEK